jgi:putative redox protein
MYAERKGIGLQGVAVRLSHARVHEKDCADCEEKDVMLDEIRSQILLEGDLDEAQRKRLLEIATRCPVHRTLTAVVRIRSELISIEAGR